jgi:hypothetical protein
LGSDRVTWSHTRKRIAETNALGLFLLGIALVLLPLRLATGALIDIFKLLWPQRGQSGTG